jgi:hypothetical protein
VSWLKDAEPEADTETTLLGLFKLLEEHKDKPDTFYVHPENYEAFFMAVEQGYFWEDPPGSGMYHFEVKKEGE